jgi:carbamoyltransferase
MQRPSHAVFGRWGPRHPHLADWGGRAALLVASRALSRYGLHRLDSSYGRARLAALRQTIQAGREAYVLGFGAANHNSGAALVHVSRQGTIDLICNEEEERYRAEKHCHAYPEHSLETIERRMRALGLGPSDLAACVSSWDYARAPSVLVIHPVLEELPRSLALLRWRSGREKPTMSGGNFRALLDSPARIGRQLGAEGSVPIVGMIHHDNHAYLSYGVSPFASSADPVMVIVVDGGGDDACTSLYCARDGELTRLAVQGANQLDSLGRVYGLLSSTQGGWPPLSSEGRYMGAAAWGDGNRLTNRFYRRLKHILHLGPAGEVHVNRALANWTRASWNRPYSDELIDILGEPIPVEEMWNPDAILNVEDISHPEITRDRVDKAAAVQMVYEDALAHIVDHLIRETGSSQLVLTGGTALNCVANMRLLECFDEHWYRRNLDRPDTRLHLWIPPVPGDAGTPVGAAYAFAMLAGARPGEPLRHAFYCGAAPSGRDIQASIESEPTAACMALGDCSIQQVRAQVADLLARAVADDCIVGIYQGASETGPRALGHRSILANPCNPDTRRLLNERVKHRELIRPLAPMLTYAAAERFFHLEEGAADDEHNAYNYMVLTARARPDAYERIPAVIHYDGTGRLQIVRAEVDPFCYEFLLAMGRRCGVEASVNTSLNVGAPIAHTPGQAITTLTRARGMDGLLMIADDGQAQLVWLEDRTGTRERLMQSVDSWARETGVRLPAAAAA